MNEALVEEARQANQLIRTAHLRGEPLRQRILGVPELDRDAWVDLAMGIPSWADDVELPVEGVPYLPCSVTVLLTALQAAPVTRDDVFVDLGSGLGRVVMLANLITGATGVGVEYQRHLTQIAERCRQGLGLEGVTFVTADASQWPLKGSVFFLYSPFNGETLKKVVASLNRLAVERPVTVCAIDIELPGLVGFQSVRLPNAPDISIARSHGATPVP